jgi:hypothetical protein
MRDENRSRLFDTDVVMVEEADPRRFPADVVWSSMRW